MAQEVRWWQRERRAAVRCANCSVPTSSTQEHYGAVCVLAPPARAGRTRRVGQCHQGRGRTPNRMRPATMSHAQAQRQSAPGARSGHTPHPARPRHAASTRLLCELCHTPWRRSPKVQRGGVQVEQSRPAAGSQLPQHRCTQSADGKARSRATEPRAAACHGLCCRGRSPARHRRTAVRGVGQAQPGT
jgi:hypothetical protein